MWSHAMISIALLEINFANAQTVHGVAYDLNGDENFFTSEI
jgi:hypothetical protein